MKIQNWTKLQNTCGLISIYWNSRNFYDLSNRLQVPSEDVNYTTNYTFTTQADQPPISTTEPVTTNVPPQSFQPMSYAQPSAPPMSPSYAPMTAPNITNEYIPQYEPFMTEDLDPAGVGLEYFGGGTRYTYQTTPSVNKLQIEPSPPTTPRPVGPVMRAKSAPGNLRSDHDFISFVIMYTLMLISFIH